MDRPVVSDAAEQIYRLLPDEYRSEDPATGWTTLRVVGAVAEVLAPVTNLLAIADPTTDPSGTAALLDPQRTPRSFLAWLGAIIGLDIQTVPVAAQRDFVADGIGADGIARRRGSRPAIQAAVNRTLSPPSPPARVWANLGGEQPFVVSVVTNTDQTPDPEAALLAALREVPGHMAVELQVVERLAVVEFDEYFVGKTVDEVANYFRAVFGAAATINDVNGWMP